MKYAPKEYGANFERRGCGRNPAEGNAWQQGIDREPDLY